MMLFNIRKAVLAIFCLAITSSAIAQETLALQDFDGGTPGWNYSSDVAFFDNGWGSDGYFDMIDISSASPLDNPNFSGNILGENDLNDDDGDGPAYGTSGFANITFEDVNINGSQNVTLSFDYQIIGYNSGQDNVKYELLYDGVGQGEVFLHEGGVDPLDASGNLLLSIPDNVNSVGLVLSISDNGGSAYSGFDNFKVEGTEPNSIVSASNNFYTASESNNNYAIPLNVIAPDDVNDIDVTIAYQSGNQDLIDGFVTTTVTIPAGATSGTFSLPRAQDGICTGTQEVVLEITAVTGGNNAQIGTPASFTVSFTDNQTTYSTVTSDNFESGTLSGWVNTDNFTASTVDAITGSYSLRHSAVDINGGYKHTSKTISAELESRKTIWQANLRRTFSVPGTSFDNWIFYALASSESNPFVVGAQGYVVGVNFDASNDSLKLIRFDNGLLDDSNFVELATADFTFEDNNTVGVRVVRDDSGNWSLEYKAGGGFSNMDNAGSATDNTYVNATYTSFGGEIGSSNQKGKMHFDNLLITQESCSATYYTVASGNSDDPIWSTEQNAGPGEGFIVSYTSNNRLTVQDGHTLTLTGEVKALDFTIDSSGIVELNANELSIYKDFIIEGNLDGTTGTLSFKGNGEQNILIVNSPIRVQNFKLQNNGPKVEIQTGVVEVTGLLMPVAGTLVTGSNPARLVLISNASGTAAVGEFNAAAEVQGNVRAQRYIPASATGWINVSSILEEVTVEQWDDDILTTGYPGSDHPLNQFTNIAGHDETINAAVDERYVNITSNSTNLPVTSGYFIYLLGGAQNIEVEGEIARDNITKNVTFSGYFGPATDGFNLVANPYPSPIDWEEVYDASTGVNPTMYIYSAQQGNYVSYNAMTNGGTASNIIPSGQSFFVKLNGGSGTLNFSENQKVGPYDEFQRSNENMKPTVQLKIAGNGEIAGYTHVTLDDEATFNYDDVDGFQLRSANKNAPEISTLSQEEEYNLSFNSVPTDEGAVAIPVNLDIPVAGTYTLEVSDLINFPSSSCLSIEDLETGEVSPVELGETFDVVTQQDSINEVRFMLHITSLNSGKSDVTCFNGSDGWVAARGAGNGPWTYTWYNEMGGVIAYEENISVTSQVDDLAFGTYYVEVEDENSLCGTLTKVIEINEPMPEELSLSSQSATCNNEDGEIVIGVENANAIEYSITGNNGSEFSSSVEGDSSIIPLLQGDVYTVNISTACNTFEQMTVDLTDENAVTAAIDIENDVVEMQDGIAEVQFSHNSENATSVAWNFGNGETSEMNNPIHTFTEVGEYEITLTAQNEICDNTDTRTITVEESVSVGDDFDPSEEITMTALRERVQLEFGNARLEQPIVEVYNTAGQLVISKKLSNVNGDIILIETAGLRQGIYSLTILENDSRVFSEQFVR
ncbi:PKD domain-containing protein [Halocola ammonii]